MKKVTTAILLYVLVTFQGFSQIVINEIFASNINAFLEKTTFNYPGYIEFYNKGFQPASLSGFFLSDNPSNPTLWTLPWNLTIQSKGFLVIYCDGLNYENHSNFKLDADGGKIILYDRGYRIIDSLTYGRQFYNLPFGQKPDGSKNWTRLADPTPKYSNNNVQSNYQICPKPTITPQAGFYSGNVTVSLLSNFANVQIRYTTNGSEPNIKSPLYTVPFQVNVNTVVKAKSFHSQYLPSSTTCNTFLLNQHRTNLPVVSVSTNNEYLFDDSIGIYVVGKNGVEGNCYGKSNWNREWERPAVFEYFDSQGTVQFSQGIDMKVAGACSRTAPQKSFALLPSSRYGSGNFDYPFFASKPYKTGYGSLLLRNSGNDFNTTMFRDAFIQELCINQMDVDYQAYQPTAVYVNGNYWGLMNLREKIDKSYLKANQSLPIDSVILLERNAEIISGSNQSYLSFTDSLSIVDMSTTAGYRFLDRNIDINEYLNYLVVQIYCENKDWPGNNIKFWKSIEPGSKWRWILTDLDFGMGLYGASPVDPTLNFVTETNGSWWPNPPWSTLLIRKVFENSVTRALFIQKMQAAINTVFSQERVNSKIDSIKNYIAPEMPYHWQRWGSNSNDWNWNSEVMRNFNNSRSKFMRQHLRDFFSLSGNYTELSIKNSENGKTNYFFNQIQITDTLPKQFVSDVPLEIEAVPFLGYVFDKWEGYQFKSEKIDLIQRGSVWKYFDKETDQLSANWQTYDYDDSLWPEGPAELGYGDGDEKTVVSYGANANNKIITTAYRQIVNIDNLDNIVALTAEILFDDGAVIYLNGNEISRYNMPEGVINVNTLASFSNEGDFKSFDIPKSLFQIGRNVMAVEIHQSNATSSDISFDFSLFTQKKELTGSISFNEAKISGTFDYSMELKAFFKEVEPLTDLVINEVSVSNNCIPDNAGDFEDWIEIYNGSDKSVDLSKVFIDYKGATQIQWQIFQNGSLILDPGKYIVFWADNETDEGSFHFPFKLNGEGEVLKLVQPVGERFNVLDSVKVAAKYANETLGRFPDGKIEWYRMATVTPGKSNVYSPTQVPSVDFDKNILVYPNPATDYLFIEMKNIGKPGFDLTIIGNDGRIINEFLTKNSIERFDISDIRAGVYILKIKNGNSQVLRKLILLK